jgi:hypothetical protein
VPLTIDHHMAKPEPSLDSCRPFRPFYQTPQRLEASDFIPYIQKHAIFTIGSPPYLLS